MSQITETPGALSAAPGDQHLRHASVARLATSARQVRRGVRELRPRRAEAYLRLRAFPGEEAQADWADFGSISVGRRQRRLSAFVMSLSYSRALYVEFFLDQKTENFLLGHQRAFEHFGGAPRAVRIDNFRSAVLEVFRLHSDVTVTSVLGGRCLPTKPRARTSLMLGR